MKCSNAMELSFLGGLCGKLLAQGNLSTCDGLFVTEGLELELGEVAEMFGEGDRGSDGLRGGDGEKNAEGIDTCDKQGCRRLILRRLRGMHPENPSGLCGVF